jgi:hypothetical protein
MSIREDEMAVETLEELITRTTTALDPVIEQLGWAEDEITSAQERHPQASADLWHSFRLLIPTHDTMSTEFVYRAHVRELLDRVVKGEDTRPGTWAEIVGVCRDVSVKIPMHGALGGLFFRAWARAFPDREVFIDRSHHEALHSSEIDDLESTVRRRLSVRDRRLEPPAGHS